MRRRALSLRLSAGAVAVRGDEAAPAGGGFDQAAPDELLVGFLDRAAGRIDLLGQVALGRELLAGLQAARTGSRFSKNDMIC